MAGDEVVGQDDGEIKWRGQDDGRPCTRRQDDDWETKWWETKRQETR